MLNKKWRKVKKRVNMYSICARSSYGRICASYFCIVGSAKDSTDRRNITSKENMLLLLLLRLTSSCACGYFFWFTRTRNDCVTLWKSRNKIGWQELSYQNASDKRTLAWQCIICGIYFFCRCIIDGQRTRRIWKFCCAHCFLSLSFLSGSLICLPVYMCQTLKKKCVCLHMSRRVVLYHQASDETLMLTLRSSPIFFFFKVCLLHQGCTAWLFHIQFKEAENKIVLHVACWHCPNDQPVQIICRFLLTPEHILVPMRHYVRRAFKKHKASDI